jgi:hypothetical protein
MVGGKVIGITRKPGDSTLVHVRGTRGERNDLCCIRVWERRRRDDSPVEIEIGDSIWWQGRDAMWTPVAIATLPDGDEASGCGTAWDIALPRHGWSFGMTHEFIDPIVAET